MWLGTGFESMAWVMIVMIIHLSVNLITSPFFNIQMSLNKIKQPALVNVALGVIYFYLAYRLSQRLGPIGIAIAGAFSLSLSNLIFSSIFTARIMKLKWWHYFCRLLIIGIVPIIVAIASYFLEAVFAARSLLDLFWIGVFISVIYVTIIYFGILSKKEKGVVSEIIGRYL
jgi:membrane protein EpsK